MNRIESKIHCTHAHKKGKSKKKRKRKTDVCVCIYLSLSFGRTRVQTVCCGNTKKSALILERERERKREGIDIKRKRKKKGVFPKSLKNPKYIGMEFRVCVVCLVFFAASRTNASSLAHIRHNISVCAQHTRARRHTQQRLSTTNTEERRERKRGRRVLFLFVLVEY